MRPILIATVAKASAAMVAEWCLTNPYSQGKTLGRKQCTWWDSTMLW